MAAKRKTDSLISCKERCGNMVPYDQEDETCSSCKYMIRQRAEWVRANCCRVCKIARVRFTRVCFGCRMARAAA